MIAFTVKPLFGIVVLTLTLVVATFLISPPSPFSQFSLSPTSPRYVLFSFLFFIFIAGNQLSYDMGSNLIFSLYSNSNQKISTCGWDFVYCILLSFLGTQTECKVMLFFIDVFLCTAFLTNRKLTSRSRKFDIWSVRRLVEWRPCKWWLDGDLTG